MENGSHPFYFNLTAFGNIGYYRYPAFIFCFLLYSVIVFANVIIILVISREKSLHQPMYILILCLCINSLYGSAGFFPRFLIDLLSDTHAISLPACFTQIFFIYSYATFELTMMSAIAYDRYVAVCHPLHYHNKMTANKVITIVAAAYIYPVCVLSPSACLSFTTPLCGNNIPKVFCANWLVLKLSCVTTFINNVVGLFLSGTIFAPLLFVAYTYVRILLICRKGTSESRLKVLQSCLPHIVTFANFAVSMFCDVVLSRFNIEEFSPFAAIVISLEFVVIPPIVNPLMYGIKLQEIKKNILKCYFKK
ncbi:olfactory receptor 51L1-like [Gadus morhua]|uniref:Olfactory receptor n=1 Tax=Gadus morhua TaxID=8049 RepID=A0A8C4ZCW3_GADMO|nr:olfactory receptor 51L1-like [Gadus morhua]